MEFTKSFSTTLILAGMTLGTAWAIRGQFGHEQGAAWAGAIGCLGVILLSNRADWYSKALRATLAGAIGWGLGGLMSYGLVVGYGRGDDFPNVYYGLTMLFVIGGLYGFLGGGLFGLVLEESEQKPVDWPRLIIEMAVMAGVFYFFLIMEWEWNMTPPRSEMWAACLGMAVALAWYQVRSGRSAALRIAIFAGLGAGFGFAFGNFLQVMGTVSGIKFNFWNVMEYSLGFFGGIGMAYGTLTASWEETTPNQKQTHNWSAIGILSLFIPLVVWDQSFLTERLLKTLTPLTNIKAQTATSFTQVIALMLMLGTGIYWTHNFSIKQSGLSYTRLRTFFLVYFGLYTICSFLITGAFLSTYRIEQYLYLVNLFIILIFLQKAPMPAIQKIVYQRHWGLLMVGILLAIAVLAFVAISSHGELKGAQVRF